jgi:hypothetical protein
MAICATKNKAAEGKPACWGTCVQISEIGIIVAVLLTITLVREPLTRWYLIWQDGFALFAAVLVWQFGAKLSVFGKTNRQKSTTMSSKIWLPALAMPIMLIGWLGHHIIFQGHALTRDEQMVLFDAVIFAKGQAIAPLSVEWRPYLAALNDTFLLPKLGNTAWVSGYLPGNAFIHMVAGKIGAGALVAPLFMALGFISLLWSIRILWPDRRDVQITGALLYILSAQILTTSMTVYAMSAHLGLGTLWFALFLRDRWWSHGAAMLTGFVITGLHQLVLHPIFVLPILCLLLLRKRWSLSGCYIAAYAAIGLFWLSYPGWAGAGHFVSLAGSRDGGISVMLARTMPLLANFSEENFGLMAANLLRLLSWNHLLLLPLAMLGAVLGWRAKDRLRIAMAASVLLTFLTMLIILPYQGHGWGYRYLHAHLGVLIILALYGWVALADSDWAGWTPLWHSACAVSFVLLSVHLWQAHRMIAPYVEASEAIAAMAERRNGAADIVVVDTGNAPFADDLVINQPDLKNRPIRLNARNLGSEALVRLCRRYRVAVLGDGWLKPIRSIFDVPQVKPATITPCPVTEEIP